ncbi:MAG: prepilin peptidase [Propionibacteriaceae bacterium]|nr:prepilin peptidase [Propionibacteriaceae bacterium]
MWIAAIVAGLLTGLATGPVLRWLPEPADGAEANKRSYRSLASLPFAAAVTACAIVAGVTLVLRLDPVALIVWAPLATVGVLLGAIDAATTWLPLRITQVLWVTTLAAGALQIWWTSPAERGQLALRMALGALAVGVFFWAFWWLVGGLGFGDVRLAPVLGAALASVSWQAVMGGLLIGTATGAVFGLVRHLSGRHGPFPYGPALLLGAFLGVALFP